MSDAAHVPATPQRTPAQRADLVATIVLLAVLAVGCIALAFSGLFVGFVSDGCGDDCSYAAIDAGVLVAIGTPILALAIGAFVAIVRLVRRRLAWWVPVAAAVVALLGTGAGWLIASTAVA